ncbi:hypothetical protein N7532_008827 [Penicillium argentinense]|uniref:Uncharacterized protein n=1 Tax=Penicillium argentinense TaxID=1131581 RepID=A0A9W9EY46_9EURO|nr:uncharacterized protein N7532_008827 [Penicillium argentinense]KAJ5090143.1 hypothetical protein N7532_008827 [Penicillium argentinense]
MALFPLPEFSAEQVRAYVAQLLVDQHDADAEFAQRAADLWKMGRGVDFRYSTWLALDREFRAVFGDDLGSFIYRAVQ